MPPPAHAQRWGDYIYVAIGAQMYMTLIITYLTSICILMASKRGRPEKSTHVDLQSSVANDFFSSYCSSSEGPAKCWQYTKGKSTDSKKSVVWSECKRNQYVSILIFISITKRSFKGSHSVSPHLFLKHYQVPPDYRFQNYPSELHVWIACVTYLLLKSTVWTYMCKYSWYN